MRMIVRLLCVVSVVLLYRPSLSKAEEKVGLTVGVLLSLSGGLEQWCGYMRQGIELAAAEGASNVGPVKVIFEDDRSVDNKATISAARKLLGQDKVDALYSWSTSTAPVLAPLAQQAHVPLIIGAYDTRIAMRGEYVFGTVVNYDLVARSIARFFKAKGARRVGIVLAADDWSMSFDKPFREEAEKLGLAVAHSETLDPDDTEVRTVLTKLKHHDIEAVLAPLYGSALISFVRRHRELRSQSIINVGDGMFESDIKTLGVAAEGVTASQIWLNSSELAAKVRKHHGGSSDPLQLGLVASGYDVMKHIISAADSLHQRKVIISGQSLNRELKTLKSQGYLGEYMLGGPPRTSGHDIVLVREGQYQRAQNPDENPSSSVMAGQ